MISFGRIDRDIGARRPSARRVVGRALNEDSSVIVHRRF
jgi:hypothetical protein